MCALAREDLPLICCAPETSSSARFCARSSRPSSNHAWSLFRRPIRAMPCALCLLSRSLARLARSLVSCWCVRICVLKLATQKLRFCMAHMRVCMRVRACVRRSEGAQFEMESPLNAQISL